jgi:hypothetical protein
MGEIVFITTHVICIFGGVGGGGGGYGWGGKFVALLFWGYNFIIIDKMLK